MSQTNAQHVFPHCIPQLWVRRKSKNKIYSPQLAPCLQSSVLSCHIHLQSSLWNAPTLTFWSSLSVHLQSAAGPVLHHVGLQSLQRKLLSKGVRVLLAGSVTARKKKSTISSLLLSHLVWFPSYRENQNVQETQTDITLCLFFSFVSPGNIDLTWEKLRRCHLANRREGLDQDWQENLSLRQSGVTWKTLWSMCFTHVLWAPDDWNSIQRTLRWVLLIRIYQSRHHSVNDTVTLVCYTLSSKWTVRFWCQETWKSTACLKTGLNWVAKKYIE